MDRVERALRLIQADAPVPRGTLQVVFKHQTYDEVRRLGLRADTEARVRKNGPDVTGAGLGRARALGLASALLPPAATLRVQPPCPPVHDP